ncbi:adenylate and guanylate cyclase catalytic domain-containing protein [Haematococcus lacustris]
MNAMLHRAQQRWQKPARPRCSTATGTPPGRHHIVGVPASHPPAWGSCLLPCVRMDDSPCTMPPPVAPPCTGGPAAPCLITRGVPEHSPDPNILRGQAEEGKPSPQPCPTHRLHATHPAPGSAQLPHGYCAAALSCAGQLYDWVDSWLSEADAWLDTQLTWLDRDTACSLLAGTLCLVAGGWAVLSLLGAALGRRQAWLVVESGGGGVGEGEGEGAAGGAPWVHAGWVLAGLVGGVLLGRQMRAAEEAAASSRASKLLMDLLPSHIVAALLLEATEEEEDRKEEEEEEEEEGKEHAGQQQPVHAPANSNEGGLDTQPLLDAPPSLVPSSAADMPAAGQAGCRRVCQQSGSAGGVLPATTYFAAGLSSSFPKLVQLGWAQASQVLAAGILPSPSIRCSPSSPGWMCFLQIETIGDSYMVTAGLLVHDPEHAATMVRFGLAMQQVAAQVMMPNGAGPVQMRIGIHSGPVLSGVIGKIRKRFCLVGHTVNCASRMESGGIPGRIQVSSSTHALLQHCTEFQWESRGPIEVKGLGTMTPYLLVPLDTKGVDILFPQDGITDARSAVSGQAATAAEELLTGQEYRPLPRDSLSCDPHKRASSLTQLPAASTSRGQSNIAEVSDTLIPHYGTGEAASAVRGELTTSLVTERKHAFVSNSSLELWKQRGHLQCEPVSSTERSPAAFDGFGQLDTVDVAASSTNATHENYLGQLSDIDGIESGFESALWDCASAHELHMSRIQGWSQEGRLSSNSVQAPSSVSQSTSVTWPPASLNAGNHISISCASPGPYGASSVDEHTARLAQQRHDEEQALSAELYDVFYLRRMRRASCIWGLTDDPQPHMLAANHWHRLLADPPSTHTAVQTTHSSFAFTQPGNGTSCSNSRAGRGG